MVSVLLPERAEAVRDLIGRYAEAADRGRAADLAALFLPAGVLEVRGESFDAGRHVGREAITARIAASAGTAVAVGTIRHHVSSLRMRSLGDGEVRADSYFLAVTSIGPDHWGRYRDRIDFATGRPLFAHREVVHEGFAEGSWLARMNG